MLVLSPSCFAAGGHHLSPRTAIVYSLRYSGYQPPSCHIRLFSSSPLSHTVPPCIFHIPLLCEFRSLLLCQKGISVHLLPPPPGYRYTSFFFLADPGLLHENRSFERFRGVSVGRALTFSFLSLRFIPRISPSLSPITPFFSAPTFSLPSTSISSTFVSYSSKFSMGSISFLVSSHILPFFSRLRHPTLFQLPSFLSLSPVSLCQLWLATSFLACSLLVLPFQLYNVSVCLKWVHPQFCS